MADARFEDGGEAPIYLAAQDGEDLQILAALLQDAVFPITEMKFDRKTRRFALLLNRFRWEDRVAAETAKRGYERVRCLLVVEDVLAVRSQGIDRNEADMVLSLLSITWQAGEDGTGEVILTLAGDGAIALSVETLNATAKDVTRPYLATSKQAPDHGA